MKSPELLSEEWKDAQSSELEFWRQRIGSERYTNNRQNCRQWVNFWDVLLLHVETIGDVIEIGGGPIPMLGCAPEAVATRKVVEPLAQQYSDTGWELTDSVEWIAEPFESAQINEKFDLAICVNVLDHMSDPEYALAKMKDVLNNSGSLFLWVDTQRAWYKSVYRWLPFKRHDHFHPHRFTERSLLAAIRSAGFSNAKVVDWKTPRNTAKPRPLKTRLVEKFAMTETLIVASVK